MIEGIKHLLGICGEGHPSLFTGVAVITAAGYYSRMVYLLGREAIKNIVKKL
jgi:hypothetical protein